jgi:hypothetical protein
MPTDNTDDPWIDLPYDDWDRTGTDTRTSGGDGSGSGGGFGGGGGGAGDGPSDTTGWTASDSLMGLILADLDKIINELPKWLNELSMEIRKEKPSPKKLGAIAAGSSKAAHQLGSELLRAIALSRSNLTSEMPMSLHYGYKDLTLTASPQVKTEAVTGQTWVVDGNTTPVLTWINTPFAGTPPNYPALHPYAGNYIAGVGFNVYLESYGYLVASTIRVFWLGLG